MKSNHTSNLGDLATHCDNGACNPIALIHGLSAGIQGMSQDEVRNSVCVRYILGHISFLCGEGLGPSSETITKFRNLIEHDTSSEESSRVISEGV